MQRVKNLDYDEDDLYSDDEDYNEEGGDEQEQTAEDRENFAALTPVVRAELEESGVQVDDGEIEKALYYYYWDVGKSVAYLKNSKSPQTATPEQQPKKEKPKSKFDEAAEKSAEKATHTMSAKDWFKDTPWTGLDPSIVGQLVPAMPEPPRPKLLGGSSKLAKLAEERRRKAVASQNTPNPAVESLNSLDRLSISKDSKENAAPVAEPKKYPTRRKRSPTPPPREPTPPPEEPVEQLPDLRSSPTAFGRALSKSSGQMNGATRMALADLLGMTASSSPFEGPSPDDTVLKAQNKSKGLKK
ncbi:uncharacterized protein RCC_11126 [Ramularia collo-cygni]|uniref:HBS1-like protein N-terminal domain-containing protein n=1 Tax=Ramularia collo-cygni TaxID=112498 RepID=A0A2D3VH72_9PEZI|nr:uncharacterized protein RCC_11126 [Ramularia collo-cygni]CZT25395.1 uncharacterized protein RCC_11126 [Ramularia collo-cygni]